MRTLVTAKQMKAVDAHTIRRVGIPSMVLMERAALCVAEAAMSAAKETDVVWAVCGTGNNGADGVAAARMLFLKGYRAVIFVVGSERKGEEGTPTDRPGKSGGTEEFASQLSIARNLGMEIRPWQEAKEETCGLLIDAIFGVGLSRPIEGDYRQCMEMLQAKHIPYTVAVDVPSGIHGDTGNIMGIALKADVTVTFGWEKTGTALYPGREYAGLVSVCDIGFPGSALGAVAEQEEGSGYAVTYGPEDLALIPGRPAYSNKGTFGRVLIVAGSKNMCGAAYLSALAAYRTGAGLVKLLTVEENRQILQERLPEAIIATYTSDQLIQGREDFKKMIEEQMNWADVVVLGPGLGSEPYVEYLVEDILTSAFVPVIIDADGLNAIAGHPYLTTYYTENIVITPHLGEMARLTGEGIGSIRENLAATAQEYARRYGITCVLKDAATVAAGSDGSLYINSSGNSAMAKAGSGDVLTGIIAGLTAIGMEEEQAALMGVYIHGRAGDIAAGKRGRHSLLASDLADCIGPAMGTEDGPQTSFYKTGGI